MRKYTLLAIIALAATFGSAKYNYMEFVTDDGASLYISADNLSITIDGDKVTATSGSDQLDFDTASLSLMRFSPNGSSAVENLEISTSDAVVFYTTDGKYAGEFRSLGDARSSLETGIYVVKLANGGTLKIHIKK